MKRLFYMLIWLTALPVYAQIQITEEQELHFCDVYGNGIVSVPFIQLQGFVLDVLNQFDDSPEIYVTNNTKGISKIVNFHTNPQIVDVCPNPGDGQGAFYDIAINSQKELFITRKNGLLQKVNPDNCSFQNITHIPSSGGSSSSVLALSFDQADNLYEGGWTSKVKRAEAGNLQNWTVWHDFANGGHSAGDFVQIGDFLYVAWTQPNGKDYLFKVTLGPNNSYVSHENLGQIMDETFGLAAEYGRLYGITRNQLYEIDLTQNPVQSNVIYNHPHPNNYSEEWWGAAGLHEALKIEISYHRFLSEAQTGSNPLNDPYVNQTPYDDMVYIRVHEATQNTTYIIPVHIIIDPAPAANDTGLTECKDEETGTAEFNLGNLINTINPNAVNISFYASVSDLENETNPLPLIYSIEHSETVYAKVKDGSDCYGIAEVALTVPSAEETNYNPFASFCLGTSVQLTVPDDFLSYEWIGLQGEDLNQPLNTNEVTVTQPGEYGVRVKDAFGCTYTLPFEAVLGSGPEITDVEINGDSIIVHVSPSGTYEYSLDGVFWQSSSVFYKIDVNDYNIYVRDMTGCRSDVYKFTYFMIPNFISPNSDGRNDFWEIRGISKYPNAHIRIFDRYGKIFYDRNVSVSDKVWDGRYLGDPVPSGTYWYIITLEEDKNITGFLTVRN